MDEEDGLSPELPAGDVKKSGFASKHRILYDLVPQTREVVVQFGSRWSWVGPDFLHEQMLNTNFEAPRQGERVSRTFDFEQLPRASLLGRLSGFDDQGLRTYVLSDAARLSPALYGFLGRPPTQQEVDIIAISHARSFSSASQLPAIGVAAALVRAQWNTARGRYHLPLPFRIPFRYARGSNFEPGLVKFPFTSRVLLSGAPAHYAQGFFRNLMYYFAAKLVTRPLVLMWLAVAEVSSMQYDPGLADIRAAYSKLLVDRQSLARERAREARGLPPDHKSTGSRQPDVIRTVDQPSLDPTGQGTVAMAEKWRRHRNSIGAPESRPDENDDGSSNQSEPGDSSHTEPDYGYGGASDQVEAAQDTQRREEYPYQARTSGQRSAASPDTAGDSFFGEEPSSPTAGSASAAFPPRESASQSSNAPSPGGKPSAWERVRRSTAPTNQTQPSSQSDSERGSLADVYSRRVDSSSSARYGKATSKSQAQEDFDAMLEKERAGSDEQSQDPKW